MVNWGLIGAVVVMGGLILLVALMRRGGGRSASGPPGRRPGPVNRDQHRMNLGVLGNDPDVESMSCTCNPRYVLASSRERWELDRAFDDHLADVDRTQR